MEEIKIWFDQERKLIAFYDTSHKCLDVFLDGQDIRAELYDGENLIEKHVLKRSEFNFEDVAATLKDKSLNKFL